MKDDVDGGKKSKTNNKEKKQKGQPSERKSIRKA